MSLEEFFYNDWFYILVCVCVVIGIIALASRRNKKDSDLIIDIGKNASAATTEEDEEDNEEYTWQQLQDLTEFSEHYAFCNNSDGDYGIENRELEMFYQNGWELFGIDGEYYYFKKKVVTQ